MEIVGCVIDHLMEDGDGDGYDTTWAGGKEEES